MTYGLKTADYWAVGRSPRRGGARHLLHRLPAAVDRPAADVERVPPGAVPRVRPRAARATERTSHIYLTSMRLQIGLGVPAMVGMAALAEPDRPGVLREPVARAGVDPMRWLAVAAVFEIISSPAGGIAEPARQHRDRPRPDAPIPGLRSPLRLVADGRRSSAAVAARRRRTWRRSRSRCSATRSVGAVLTQVAAGAATLGLPGGSVVRPLGLAACARPRSCTPPSPGCSSSLPDLPAAVLLLAPGPGAALSVHDGSPAGWSPAGELRLPARPAGASRERCPRGDALPRPRPTARTTTASRHHC